MDSECSRCNQGGAGWPGGSRLQHEDDHDGDDDGDGNGGGGGDDDDDLYLGRFCKSRDRSW